MRSAFGGAGGRNPLWSLRWCDAFAQPDDALVRNLPAKGLHRAVLAEMLFEEDGPARVGDKPPSCRQEKVGGAIYHVNPPLQQGEIFRHITEVWPLTQGQAIVRLGEELAG